MPRTQTYHIFTNSGSGSADSLRDIKQAFAAQQVTVHFHELATMTEVIATLKGATDIILVAAGGDGTVNALVNAAWPSPHPIAVLPLGTLNHFAQDIGMPTTPAEAVEALLSGTIRTIDVAAVNDTLFVNNSSIGPYPSLVARRDALAPKFGKPLAMVIAFCMQLTRIRRHHVTLHYNGTTIHTRSSFIFVGNNRYTLQQEAFGGRASLDKGVLGVYVITAKTAFQALGAAFRALHRGVKHESAIDYFETIELTIERRHKRTSVARDGEVSKLDLPLHYVVHHKKLTIIAPAA